MANPGKWGRDTTLAGNLQSAMWRDATPTSDHVSSITKGTCFVLTIYHSDPLEKADVVQLSLPRRAEGKRPPKASRVVCVPCSFTSSSVPLLQIKPKPTLQKPDILTPHMGFKTGTKEVECSFSVLLGRSKRSHALNACAHRRCRGRVGTLKQGGQRHQLR